MAKELSGELEYRIRYDVEHDLFHVQNIFSEEYISPTFIEYIQKLEKENKELKQQNRKMKRCKICKHYQWDNCNYHSLCEKDCKENEMKLFELKEKENE